MLPRSTLSPIPKSFRRVLTQCMNFLKAFRYLWGEVMANIEVTLNFPSSPELHQELELWDFFPFSSLSGLFYPITEIWKSRNEAKNEDQRDDQLEVITDDEKEAEGRGDGRDGFHENDFVKEKQEGLGWYEVGVDWTMMDENSLSNGEYHSSVHDEYSSLMERQAVSQVILRSKHQNPMLSGPITVLDSIQGGEAMTHYRHPVTSINTACPPRGVKPNCQLVILSFMAKLPYNRSLYSTSYFISNAAEVELTFNSISFVKPSPASSRHSDLFFLGTPALTVNNGRVSTECNRKFGLTGKNCDPKVEISHIKFFSENCAVRMNGSAYTATEH
ncbi:hypothetical protein MJT46_018642 [Ovis ammon polii x Ovis aries]|nr:hypothetical protein MJT46_018642 [Ovis ammon polii x Ovis aries]